MDLPITFVIQSKLKGARNDDNASVYLQEERLTSWPPYLTTKTSAIPGHTGDLHQTDKMNHMRRQALNHVARVLLQQHRHRTDMVV